MRVSQPVTPTDAFFWLQDAPVMAVQAAILLLAILASQRPESGSMAWPTGWTGSARIALACAILALAAGWIGWRIAALRYPLSMDEFLATFDARAFAHGRLITPVAPFWRRYVPALQPFFGLNVPGHVGWSSDYLPVNAALRAAFSRLALADVYEPALNALSVWLVFDIARRLWPDRPDAAVAAVLMLVSSSQFLITGMTAYAMPAHLLANLLWLRLYLVDRIKTDIAALGVGWLATGLHQLAFHPLFAAPFILQAFTQRRWRRAVSFTIAYGLILVFWTSYWPLASAIAHMPAPVGESGGRGAFLAHVAALVRAQQPLMVAHLMTANLARFISWQNPLMIMLLLAALPRAISRPTVLQPLAGAFLLTLLVVAGVLAYQGLGWGYRYVHGLLGAAALVATQGYVDLARRLGSPQRAGRAISVSVALSLGVLAPWRAWQVFSTTSPSARAHAAILTSPAAFVVVDASRILFGKDLVRNPPDLQARLLIFDLESLSPAEIRGLCLRGPVAVFDRSDAQRWGMTVLPPSPSPAMDQLRSTMHALDCDIAHVSAASADRR